MALDKVIPNMTTSFGELLFRKPLVDKDVYVRENSRRVLQERCYELASSVQGGAIEVYIPAGAAQISTTHDGEPVKLRGPYLTVRANISNRNVEGRQARATYELILSARAIQLIGEEK